MPDASGLIVLTGFYARAEHGGNKSRRKDKRRLTRGIVIFHYSAGMDELEGGGRQVCVIGEGCAQSTEFCVWRRKGKRETIFFSGMRTGHETR